MIRPRQRLVDTFARVERRHADRYRHCKARMKVVEAGALKTLTQAITHLLCPLQLTTTEHQDELLATKTCGVVGAAQSILQLARKTPQHFITNTMPVGIVDRLEMVQVEVTDTETVTALLFCRALETGQHLHDMAAIVEPGQGIANRHLARSGVRLMQLVNGVGKIVAQVVDAGTGHCKTDAGKTEDQPLQTFH